MKINTNIKKFEITLPTIIIIIILFCQETKPITVLLNYKKEKINLFSSLLGEV